MRRFKVGLAFLAFALLTPIGVQADDRQIAKEIVDKLQEKKQEGELRNFSIDLQVKEGAVYLEGYVTQPDHQTAAIDIARRVNGVKRVYDNLEVKGRPARAEIASDDAPDRNPKSVLKKLNTMLVGAGRKASSVRPASHARRAVADRDNSKEIAQQIVGSMRDEMELGNLRGFGVDVEVDKGVVWLRGRVSSEDQEELALDIARRTKGVSKVVNELTVNHNSRRRPQPVAVEPATRAERTSDEIAEEVIGRLKKQQQNGALKNFGVDVSVDEGVVWLSGRVANETQQDLVLDQARFVRGVKQVIDDITLDTAPTIAPITVAAPAGIQIRASTNQQASTDQQAPALLATSTPAPVAPTQAVPFGYVPVQYVAVQAPRQGQMPVPIAPARPVSHNMPAQMGLQCQCRELELVSHRLGSTTRRCRDTLGQVTPLTRTMGP